MRSPYLLESGWNIALNSRSGDKNNQPNPFSNSIPMSWLVREALFTKQSFHDATTMLTNNDYHVNEGAYLIVAGMFNMPMITVYMYMYT